VSLYFLEMTCANPTCREANHVAVNLEDLEVTPYGEAREFAFALPGSGKTVRFGYLDGHKEKRLAALKEPNISSAMLIRILAIDGKAPSKKDMADMSMRDRSALRKEMARVDAGIDTTIETACEGCGTILRTRLEAEPAFLFPGVRSYAFFLAYGGLHWEFSETRSLPLETRRQFVEALERQLEFERERRE